MITIDDWSVLHVNRFIWNWDLHGCILWAWAYYASYSIRNSCAFVIFWNRPCLRRESGRFKFEETTTQPNEDDQFQINDGKLPDDPLCDDQTDEDSLSSLGLPAQNEATEASNALRCDPRVYRRSSIGRPLRLSVAKVHSYKEPSLLTKLRRADWFFILFFCKVTFILLWR